MYSRKKLNDFRRKYWCVRINSKQQIIQTFYSFASIIDWKK